MIVKAGGKVERLAPNVVKNSTKCGYKKVNWQLKNERRRKRLQAPQRNRGMSIFGAKYP